MGYSIDVESIARELDFDVEDVEMLLEAFLESCAELLPQLDKAIQSNDLEEIFKAGHSIKGIASNLLLSDISQIAKEMEGAARDGENIDYKSRYDTLKSLIDSIEE